MVWNPSGVTSNAAAQRGDERLNELKVLVWTDGTQRPCSEKRMNQLATSSNKSETIFKRNLTNEAQKNMPNRTVPNPMRTTSDKHSPSKTGTKDADTTVHQRQT